MKESCTERAAVPRTETKAEPGRPRSFSAQALEAKFDEYRIWTKENPREMYRQTRKGSVLCQMDRPLTLTGFCQFIGIVTETFRGYERQGGNYGVVCARVREAIQTDQLEGAIIGQYNAPIVARVLRLAERTEAVVRTEPERIEEMTDEELQAEIDKLETP